MLYSRAILAMIETQYTKNRKTENLNICCRHHFQRIWQEMSLEQLEEGAGAGEEASSNGKPFEHFAMSDISVFYTLD